MTDLERAVIEAAERYTDRFDAGEGCGTERYDIRAAVRARRAAQMVRCPDNSCALEACTHKHSHTQRPECTDPALDPDCPNCRPEPVEEPMDQTISTVLDRLSKMPKADFDKALAEHRDGFYARLIQEPMVPEVEDRIAAKLESRVADLERKEKAHWARLNDFDRRVTDLENDLRGLENAHITLGGIVSEEIKKWAKK